MAFLRSLIITMTFLGISVKSFANGIVIPFPANKTQNNPCVQALSKDYGQAFEDYFYSLVQSPEPIWINGVGLLERSIDPKYEAIARNILERDLNSRETRVKNRKAILTVAFDSYSPRANDFWEFLMKQIANQKMRSLFKDTDTFQINIVISNLNFIFGIIEARTGGLRLFFGEQGQTAIQIDQIRNGTGKDEISRIVSYLINLGSKSKTVENSAIAKLGEMLKINESTNPQLTRLVKISAFNFMYGLGYVYSPIPQKGSHWILLNKSDSRYTKIFSAIDKILSLETLYFDGTFRSWEPPMHLNNYGRGIGYEPFVNLFKFLENLNYRYSEGHWVLKE